MEPVQAEDHNSFYMGDHKISTLKELLEVLENPELEAAAKAHITDDKNDYSNWIDHVLGDKDLADKMREFYKMELGQRRKYGSNSRRLVEEIFDEKFILTTYNHQVYNKIESIGEEILSPEEFLDRRQA